MDRCRCYLPSTRPPLAPAQRSVLEVCGLVQLHSLPDLLATVVPAASHCRTAPPAGMGPATLVLRDCWLCYSYVGSTQLGMLPPITALQLQRCNAASPGMRVVLCALLHLLPHLTELSLVAGGRSLNSGSLTAIPACLVIQ